METPIVGVDLVAHPQISTHPICQEQFALPVLASYKGVVLASTMANIERRGLITVPRVDLLIGVTLILTYEEVIVPKLDLVTRVHLFLVEVEVEEIVPKLDMETRVHLILVEVGVEEGEEVHPIMFQQRRDPIGITTSQ